MANSNARRRRLNNSSRRNTTQPGILSAQGEIRRFNFSGGVIKGPTEIRFDAEHLSALRHELSGVAEWRIIQATVSWNPMVSQNSDAGVVGMVAYPSEFLKPPTDVDGLLRYGMHLRPASSSFSTQCGAKADWVTQKGFCGGIYVYTTKTGQDIGRISGTLMIRVRGVGPL